MLIHTMPLLKSFLRDVEAHKGPISYDVETNGTNAYKGNRIIGYAFHLPKPVETLSYYIPVRQNPWRISCVGWQYEDYWTPKLKVYKPKPKLVETGNEAFYSHNLDPETVASLLQQYVFNGRLPVFGWNVKFDQLMTEFEGIEIENKLLDVMLAAHLEDENHRSYELKVRGAALFGKEETEEKDALKEYADKYKIDHYMGRLAEFPIYLLAEYAEQDTVLTSKCAARYKTLLCQQQPAIYKGTNKTLFDIWQENCQYNIAIHHMEKNGLRVDMAVAREAANLAQMKTDELYQAMAKIVGHEFNPRSNPELRRVMKLPKTNKAYLALSDNPMAPMLEEYRKWERALRTYYLPWLEMSDDEGLLHPNLMLIGTVSGRLSCRQPNMQNLPRASSIYDVRRAIIAPPGKVLLEADYSQIELRIATHYCQDPTWMETYLTGGDIHQQTADLVGLTRRYGAKQGRQAAKTLNFAMLYGMGPNGLSSSLTMAGLPTTIAQAQEILQNFRGNKPKLVKLCNDVIRFARREHYIELWTGRRRHYPPRPWLRGLQDDTHSAPNNLIQGGAAELMRHAITRLDVRFEKDRKRGVDAPRMHLQVHDSIMFSMDSEQVAEWAPIIRDVMENCFKFNVPIRADFKVGPAWAALESVEV